MEREEQKQQKDYDIYHLEKRQTRSKKSVDDGVHPGEGERREKWEGERKRG